MASVFITPQGTIKHIYSDDLAFLSELGQSVTRRASDVEPCRGGWAADMGKSNGPVLGPFPLRQQALDAEVAWLLENNLPVPSSAA